MTNFKVYWVKWNEMEFKPSYLFYSLYLINLIKLYLEKKKLAWKDNLI